MTHKPGNTVAKSGDYAEFDEFGKKSSFPTVTIKV